ncbi:MAG: methionine gamma-lyase family protein [Ruminococcus sp.]
MGHAGIYQQGHRMAAGAFTMGASIELSADAPIREPFAVWMQGGITYNSGKIGILLAAREAAGAGTDHAVRPEKYSRFFGKKLDEKLSKS